MAYIAITAYLHVVLYAVLARQSHDAFHSAYVAFRRVEIRQRSIRDAVVAIETVDQRVVSGRRGLRRQRRCQ